MNIKQLKETVKYMLRSYPVIKKYVDEVEELYAMTPMELKARNDKKFINLFQLAYTKSPFYHKLYTEAGIKIDDIQSIEDIVKLPIVTKDMIRGNSDSLLTCGKSFLISNHTSGTTGTPLTVYESWPALWREQAYFVSYRKRCGFNYGEPLVSLRGVLCGKEKSLRVGISNTLFLSSYNINDGTANLYFKEITKHKAKAIEGYPSSLYNLALIFRDKGLECNIPIAFTSSESLFDYQRALIENVFHCQLFDHYGTTERTIRLEEDFNHDGYFEDPGYGIEEYHDGYIISTSLINDAFPLIRYKQYDIIKLKEDKESLSSRNFIKSIEGRTEDYVVCKDGTRLKRFGFVVKDVENLDISQIVQFEKGKVEIRLVSKNIVPDNILRTIKNNMEERCGVGNMDVTVKQVDETGIEYTKKNKFKYIYSTVK